MSMEHCGPTAYYFAANLRISIDIGSFDFQNSVMCIYNMNLR